MKTPYERMRRVQDTAKQFRNTMQDAMHTWVMFDLNKNQPDKFREAAVQARALADALDAYADDPMTRVVVMDRSGSF